MRRIILSTSQLRFIVDIAESDADQTVGMSHYASIEPNYGILFPLRPGTAGFTLRETRFPLDIFWLDRDMRVLDAVRTAPALSSKLHVPVPGTAYVLELRAGSGAGLTNGMVLTASS